MSYQSVITDPVALAQRHHPVASVLLPDALEFAFHVMGSRRDFFDEMRLHIRPEHFIFEERLLALLWVVMCQVADQIAGPFHFETLGLAMQAHLVNQQEKISPTDAAALFTPDESGILWTMTKSTYETAHVTYARGLLQRFLVERSVVNPLRHMLRGPMHPENIQSLIATVHEHSSRVAGLSELPRVIVAPPRGSTIYEPSLIYKRTGVPYVDNYLGGQVSGDCNGIIGVTGGGKTTTAIHMASSTALMCWGDAVRDRTAPEFVAYISVEEEGTKLLPRIWSSACSIPLDKLRKMSDWNALTTQANLDTYERELARRDNSPEPNIVPSESERYDAEQPALQACFELLDFSGSGAYQNSGHGYVNEIRSALDRVQQLRQQSLRSVFVDYAGLLVARATRGALDDRQLRAGLNALGDEFHQMAQRFDCTVWLLHQLRGAVGTQSPIKLMSHHDSGETKDFANNLANCGCIGTRDPITGCRRLNWSKTRTTRAESIPAAITLRIHDSFAVMEEVSERYVIDEASRSIISIEQRNQVQAPLPTAGPPGLAMGGRGRPHAGAATTQAALNTSEFTDTM